MKLIQLIIFFMLINLSVAAELVTPNANIKPEEVVKIQLEALQNNNSPYQDFGISQTWEFAHPSNRKFTGPLSKFTKMMKSGTYSLILDHINHNIILVSANEDTVNFFVEITDKAGNKVGFKWIVKKVLTEGEFKDCWMTSGVSQPMPLAKSA